ncbi:MAG TPA: hypothetical protein VF771_17910, partial [Longimicrobiaceae bacterium]
PPGAPHHRRSIAPSKPLLIMKCIITAAALLALTAAGASAQSCPAGDEVAGPVVHANRYRRNYDRMTDTTRLGVSKLSSHVLAWSQDATFSLVTAFEGQAPRAPVGITLTISTTSERKENSTQTASRELNHLADAQVALVLVDNATRMQLPRVSYGDRVRQANLLSNDRLVENAVFAITPDQLRAIASATQKVEIAAGMARGSLGRGEIEAAKELYRVAACALPAQPAVTETAATP